MPRVDGYIRVSRVGKRTGERFMSPDLQRDAILAWADGRRDVEVMRVFEELDESGRRADRPLLMEAIRRIEAGDTDGLVVWRVSRFGRSLLDGLSTIERVREVGGTFYAVADGLDTGTDAGRLVLRILLSVAQRDVEQMTLMWAMVKERAIHRASTPTTWSRSATARRPAGGCGPTPTAPRS
jgi:DNA invertase Pin-like site-specific DNA recombinase